MRIKLALLALIMTGGLTITTGCGDEDADTAEDIECDEAEVEVEEETEPEEETEEGGEE